MTLQASGPISINDLVAEFGGVSPHSLWEYFRGGGLVPDIAANANVPTTFPISLQQFYGATAASVVIPLQGQYCEDVVADPADATCGITFNSNGGIGYTGNGGPGAGFNWFLPTTGGIGASYWVKAQKLAGDDPFGALNTWLQLSSNRSWFWTATSPGLVIAASVRFFIATAANDANIVSQGDYEFHAEVLF